GIARVILVRHSRIMYLVMLPKFPSEALDKLVVPSVMRALAASLNEEQLAFHVQMSSSSAANQMASTESRISWDLRRPRAGSFMRWLGPLGTSRSQLSRFERLGSPSTIRRSIWAREYDRVTVGIAQPNLPVVGTALSTRGGLRWRGRRSRVS